MRRLLGIKHDLDASHGVRRRFTSRLQPLVASGLLMLGTVARLIAADVAWQTPQAVSGDTDVATNGTLVCAYTQSGLPATCNGVTFAAGSSHTSLGGGNVTLSGFAGVADVFNNGHFSGEYANLITGGAWADAQTGTVSLNNLTSGHQYLVQLWVADYRSYGFGRTEVLDGQVTLAYQPGQYVIGTFTASGANQVIHVVANAAVQINAIQVRDLAVVPPVDLAVRAEELKSLRWGMFICWSFSTFSGVEWTTGVTNINFFSATDVDTDQWARTAKEAGMGYILFLTKHHDGFCLWDTQTTARKVTNAPLGRDVLAELKQSCDKYGIKLALYFSEGEFSDNATYHPGGYTPEMKKAQLKELLTRYGPIEYIWFDHAQGTGGVTHAETANWCHQWQPGTLIGFNHGDAAGEISLRERGRPGPLGDPIASPYNWQNEQEYPGFLLAEFTYPILPDHVGGADWFYSLPIHNNLCHLAEKLYSDYQGAVKYGNIFSINVGPGYNGRLRDIDVATLREVGEMIKNPPIPPLSENKPAQASSVWGAGFEADKAVDGDIATRWGAAPDSRSGWLEVDLQEAMTVGRTVVMEIGYPRTQEFAVEYKSDDTWQPILTGTTIAGRKVLDFSPVTARYWRLNILLASDVPTIEEFQLQPPRFSASPVSSSRIDLTWTPNGSDEKGFVIERSLSPDSGFSLVANVGANATLWSDASIVPGTAYYYRVSATSSADNTSYTMQASATVWTVLEEWRNAHWDSIINTGNAENTADPDSDGLPNLMEFALGTNPQVAAQPGARLFGSLVTVSAAQRMSLTFARRHTAAGISYVVETSPDLSEWTANAIQLGTPSDNGDGTESVTFYDPNSSSPSVPCRFIRLRVTSP